MPRPLSDDDGLASSVEPEERRDLETGARRSGSKTRNFVILACIVVAFLLPALAEACAPGAAPTARGIRLLDVSGVERVKMEVAYRSEAGTADGTALTRYRVISAPVPADGHVTDGLPPAAKLVSAEVIAASGPACR